MPKLLIVGAGLFGSQAAAYARSKGIETVVFDAGLEGAASPASVGLSRPEWLGKKLEHQWAVGLAVLERLYKPRNIELTGADGSIERFLCLPPGDVLEREPVRQTVTAVGDGWLEADGQRHEGFVYVAAGVWCTRFVPDLEMRGKAGTSWVFAGEKPNRIRPIAYGRPAVAFVREPGQILFADGTAEEQYMPDHDRQSLARAAELFGLTDPPLARRYGIRPFTPGGPLFKRLGQRTWLATGARKLGIIMGAAYARRLIEEEMRQP